MIKINNLPRGFLLPSAAYTISPSRIKFYKKLDSVPEIGDVAYGVITRIGQHKNLENKSGRLHEIQDGTKAIFVFGNRYAPAFYEGFVPKRKLKEVDLLAGSGLIGIVQTKSSFIIDPTRVKIHGYVCDKKGRKINTKDYPLITPRSTKKKNPRAKLILVCGTSMNSGKSKAASACVWALTSRGHKVRASKATGTASLKDILHMNDAGARPFTDFSFLGYPSTYLIKKSEVLKVFNTLDLKYGNNPKNYWVVEFADGINQRETAFLLNSPDVRSRIHKLIFCAFDAFGAVGGVKVLKEEFGLVPDAISGICTSSPLHIKEIMEFTDIPIFDSVNIDLPFLNKILTSSNGEKKTEHSYLKKMACGRQEQTRQKAMG